MSSGPHVERLTAVAANKKYVAIGGWRDTPAPAPGRVHLLAHTGGKAWSVAFDGVVNTLWANDELLFGGSSTGRLAAWDASDSPGEPLLDVLLGAPIRAITGANDRLVVVGDDAQLRLFRIAAGAKPALETVATHALGARPLTAVAFDTTGAVLVGADDGNVWAIEGSTVTGPLTAGGDGGVRSIAGLGDGRFVAGYGDGSIRIGYYQGNVDAQDRSGERAHEGAIRGLGLAPQLTDAAGRDLPRRVFTASEDGTVRSWFLEGRRPPRTLTPGIGTLTAAVVLPGAVRGIANSTGRIFVVSAGRKLASWTLGQDGDITGDATVIDSELDRLAGVLNDRRPRTVAGRNSAVDALAALAEDDARLLLQRALTSDTDATVRARAATALAAFPRARVTLRGALVDREAPVRTAAFSALSTLEAADPVAALRAALGSTYEDVRLLALGKLPDVIASAPLAVALCVDALNDGTVGVRIRAFDVLLKAASAPNVRVALGAAAEDPLAAHRVALERGPADVRARALLQVGLSRDDAARQLVAESLDDTDATVGNAAFDAALLQHPRLLGRIQKTYPKLAAQVSDLGPADAELSEADLAPLFAAVACRAPAQAVRGAEGLVGVGDTRAIGVILRLTRVPDPALRRSVVGVLAAARAAFPEEERLESRLAWLLDDGDGQVRALAFGVLEKAAQGPAAELGFAGTALRASQLDIRVRALQIVVKHGKGAEAGVAAALLADALDDEGADVRKEAFRTLWAWNSRTPDVPLDRGAKSRHADIRGQVVAEIGRRRQGKQSNAKLDAILLSLVPDAVPDVALAAYGELTRQEDDAKRVDVHVAAMKSPAPAVRAAGAKGSPKAASAAAKTLPNPLVSLLYGLIKEDIPAVHLAAIEALDEIAPKDGTGFALAFDSIFYELRVRAAELLGQRRDNRAVLPMQKLLSIPATDTNRPTAVLRQRAASALADVGDPSVIPYFVALLTDSDPIVREMAARGLANACGPGREQPLVDALAHGDLAVRSWAAEGLARIGDLRGLPVLAGTQAHVHGPLRIGAIVGLVALGPDGVRGLRQGLEDPDREVQDLVFAVIVARDAALARAGLAPDLLVDALSASSADIAFAAARLVEARAAGEELDITEFVGPERPEKAADMKAWPPEARRTQLLTALIDSIASDDPVRRYAAARVQTRRSQPLTFWREAARLATPAELIPHTNWAAEAKSPRKSGWLRRLVTTKKVVVSGDTSELARVVTIFRATGGNTPVPPRGENHVTSEARRLVFGTYSGLVRQAPRPGEADETHRVRRDAVGRLVALAAEPAVGRDAVLTVLAQALRDPHHLVRQAAMVGLQSLHPPGALAPLAQALGSAADVGRHAVDQLVTLAIAGNAEARALALGALDAEDAEVRTHAALRVVRLFPAGSAEPFVLAARSRHSDVRMEAVARLVDAAGTGGPDVLAALAGALTSDRADLRFRAAVGLAKRGDARGVDVLGGFLKSEEHGQDALAALVELAATPTGAAAAAAAISRRIDEDTDRSANRNALLQALGKLGSEAGLDTLLATLASPDPEGKAVEQATLRMTAMTAITAILRETTKRLPDGRTIPVYRPALARRVMPDVVKCADAKVRAVAANVLKYVDDRAETTGTPVADLLARLLSDRDPPTRVAACEAIAFRAEVFGASLAPLEAALRAGRRELVLPAAEGLALKRRPEAFQALLLVLKAGEPPERERALLALGSLGDPRSLEHILPLLEPTEEGDATMVPPAFEAVGRLLASLPSHVEGHDLVALRERLERAAIGGGATAPRALAGLRHAGDERSRHLLERIARSDDMGNPKLAVDELGRLGNVASEAVLAELLSAKRADVRQAALAALYKIFPQDRTRVDLHALGSPYEDINGPVARSLAMAGDPDVLVRRLGGVKSANTRRRIREGLVRRRALPVSAIEAALKADEPETRAEAAWMAGSAADAALAAAVAASANRGATGWREARTAEKRREDVANAEAAAWRAALWAARRIPGAMAIGPATAGLGAQVPAEVRREALAWLVENGRAELAAAAVGDGDRVARSVAARAASRFPADRAQAVVKSLGSRVDPVADAPLLKAVLPAAGPALVEDASTRGVALTVAVSSREIDVLLEVARQKGASAARLAAIAALGRVGGDAARAALEAIFNDKAEDKAARAAAWKAYRRLKRAATVRFKDGVDREKRGGFGGGSEDYEEDDSEDEDSEDEDEDEEEEEEEEDYDEDEDEDEDDDYEDDEEEDDDE